MTPPRTRADLPDRVAHPAWIVSRVQFRADGCWIWTKGKTPSGYGNSSWTDPGQPTVGIPAHRLSYIIFNGPIADGEEVDHVCTTRACVNPLHLELVSHQENVRRTVERGRHRSLNGEKTHCPQGHPYVGANLRIWTDKHGTTRRYCVTCVNARNEAMRQERERRRSA